MTLSSILLAGYAGAFVLLVTVGTLLRNAMRARLAAIGTASDPRLRVNRSDATLRLGSRRAVRRLLRPYRGVLAVTVLLAVTETVLALGAPWPLKLIIDNALGAKPLPAGLPMVGGMKGLGVVHVAVALGVGLVVAAAVVSYLVSVLVGTASVGIGADLRSAVFDRLLLLPAQVHDRYRSGDLVTRLTSDVSRVQQALVARVQVALPSLLTMVGMTALMLLLDARLTLVVLAAAPPLAVLAVLRQRRVADVQRAARSRAGELASRAAEVMRHVRAVQTFSQEPSESQRFRIMSGMSARAAGEALETSARMAPTADLVLAVVLAAVLWIGTARVVAGHLSLGELMIFLSYLGSVRVPIRALSGLAATLGRGTASQERLTEILSEAQLPEPKHPSAPPERTDLRLEHVSFGYTPEAPVLRDVSLCIPAEQTTCIVGRTGAGKSTLVSLLVRLHDPGAGVVRIGGLDLRDMRLADLRALVSFVPQDAWVMAGTIRENVCYGTTSPTDIAVRAACETALVDEFADRLPDGLETLVGESGTLLSGGQRRRVALARALLRDSPLLLLDEPTSGLDAASENLVVEAIRRASERRTVVIVSHQLSLAETADLVVVLAAGTIAQVGHPADLRRQAHGPYARLLQHQRAMTVPATRGGSSPVQAGRKILAPRRPHLSVRPLRAQ